MIPFRSVVKDSISDFEGTVTGRTEYINGCIQYLVVPKVFKNGTKIDSLWIDEVQLIVLKEYKPQQSTERTGGPSQPDNLRTNTPPTQSNNR